jgi:GH24 family phage-related lysozyme (muramidase)
MTWGEIALPLIKEFEGCKLKAYRDQRGVATVGYGATGPDVSMRTTWTQEQADSRLLKDIQIRVEQLKDMLDGAPTTDNQGAALLDLGYNIGMGALRGSTALRKHKAGDYQGAADAILMWCKVNGAANEGLARRRKADRDLYISE